MRILARSIVTLYLVPLCLVGQFKPFDGPKPIAVLIQADPWRMVIGADTPRVAVYENGEVIFAKKLKNRVAYHHIMLDQRALALLRERLHPVLTDRSLKPWYEIVSYTDQPIAKFYLRDGSREIATEVYGLGADGFWLPYYTFSPKGKKLVTLPADLMKLHKWFRELDYSTSTEWTPRYVEVMFWDCGYKPGTSIKWPKAWPGLHSKRAIKRGDSYSIFLDGALLPKLRSFLATLRKGGAVDVNGKKMAVSYRYTFPGEPTWRKAFAAAERASVNGGG